MALPESSRPPLPERLLGLLRESRWLLLVAVALYLILILYGYNRADPSWSHSASAAFTRNPGGVLGAWLADVLLYLFGFSAWWWVTLMLQRVWAGYHRIRADSVFDQRALWVSLLGFLVLLFASSALEDLRLYTWKVALPGAHGGMFGAVIGGALSHVLGFTGATLLLLALMVAGFSLYTGLSWLRFADWLGALLEDTWFRVRDVWQTRQDKRIGAQATQERSVVVEEGKRSAVWKRRKTSASKCRSTTLPRSAHIAKRKSRSPCSRICRTRTCRPCICSTSKRRDRSRFRRDAGIHFAPHRAQAQGFRRGGQGGSPPILGRSLRVTRWILQSA